MYICVAVQLYRLKMLLITNCISIYRSIKDFGMKTLVVGGLVAVLSGCEISAWQLKGTGTSGLAS